VIPESNIPAVILGKDVLDPFQERDRDGAAHAAAIEGEDALGAGPEQMSVAVAFERRRGLVHRCKFRSMPGGRPPGGRRPGDKMTWPMRRSTAHSAAWVFTLAVTGK
jgi:hypothetical protein